MSQYDTGATRETGMRRMDRLGMVRCTYQPTNAPVDFTPAPMQEQYVYTMKLQTEFWANPAQLPRTAEGAYRHLMCMLHRDELDLIHQTKFAIQNHDIDEAMDLLAAIECRLKGVET